VAFFYVLINRRQKNLVAIFLSGADMEKIHVFDTTLRDGEQAAGTRLGAREKLEVARQLQKLGVDIIEAGYPLSSPEDFAAVHLVAEEMRGVTICALSRAVKADIDACARALHGAAHSRIHTGIGVSDVHVMGKFGDEKYGATLGAKQKRLLEMAVDAVRYAGDHAAEVEFYAEDAGRADRAFVLEFLQAIVEAGAKVLNIPDTTGYAVPDQYGALIADICEYVVGQRDVVVSVHCHNDLGLAVANSLVGVQNGARQIEATINGLGERAGNAALEEVVMALRTRRDFYGMDTEIDAREFYRTSRLVADRLGVGVSANKAVVGSSAFAHSSGIHVDGFLKDRSTYEIMDPGDVGFPVSRVVLTARTGRHGLKHRLAELGHVLGPEELEQVYARFLSIADKKQEVFDEDLEAIVGDEIHVVPEVYKLEYVHVSAGTGSIPTATVRVAKGGEAVEGSGIGDGPVDAVCRAIAAIVEEEVVLSQYEIRAVSRGTEAMGEATLHLQSGDTQVVGRGASIDVVEASAKAYVDGLNKLVERGGMR
jgi:2-isopropylmalate synthase